MNLNKYGDPMKPTKYTPSVLGTPGAVGKANTSGYAGVSRKEEFKRATSWVARIGHKGKTIHLGHFDTFEEAVAARQAAEREYW